VPIADITVAIAAAIARAAGHVAGPIRLVGHSAGGHLVARMACADGPLPAEVAERLQAVCTISGLHDLRPFLSASGMNATLRLNMAQAAAESPALHAPRPGLPVNAWVGGAERPELIRQSRLLAHAWGEACRLHVADEANHFDVVEPLMVPLSLLSTVCLGPGD
jgi:acetyl esterase/lipase